jgi:cytochrome c
VLLEQRCAQCRAVAARAARAAPTAGPNLRGVVGRRVVGDPGFDYSPVLERAGRGDSWASERLVRFLEGPEEKYPGLWMGNNGLRAEAEQDAVVRFLEGQR